MRVRRHLFARDRKLPEIHEGDVCRYERGAYAFSMASQYNSRPRPAEVLVRDGESEVVRGEGDPSGPSFKADCSSKAP